MSKNQFLKKSKKIQKNSQKNPKKSKKIPKKKKLAAFVLVALSKVLNASFSNLLLVCLLPFPFLMEILLVMPPSMSTIPLVMKFTLCLQRKNFLIYYFLIFFKFLFFFFNFFLFFFNFYLILFFTFIFFKDLHGYGFFIFFHLNLNLILYEK